MKDKFVISGVEGVNKGAELMLYAILKEIELRYPNSEVYLPISQFPQGLKYIETSLELKQSPNKFVRFLGKYHLTGLLNRLGLRFKYLNNLYPIKDAKYYLDASGLYFSDQMIKSNQIAKDLKILLHGYREQGTKIIYLPQAFGPFRLQPSTNAVRVALEYSDLVIARDNISRSYLLDLKQDTSKIKQFYDFTELVQGRVPEQYTHLAGKICVILNKQVVNKGIMTKEAYLYLITGIINTIYREGYEAFFMDHSDDVGLVNECLDRLSYDIPVVEGLGALEVKGVISQSYLCVSSRFHGVVSSFSSGVPCLTTSWNHKYQELLSLYEMEGALLGSSYEDNINILQYYLSKSGNEMLRAKLKLKNKLVHQNINEMWELVWNL